MVKTAIDGLRSILREFLPALSGILTFVRQSIWVIAGVTISLASSILYVALRGSWNADKTSAYGLWILIAWICSYIVTFWASIGAIVGAFSRQEKRVLLSRILTSYFALILMFTGLYYSMAFAGDLRDARVKYVHYRHESQLLRAGLLTRARIMKDQRAFQGIRKRLWSGVDWPTYGKEFIGYSPEDFEVDLQSMLASARQGRVNNVVRFIPSAQADVFADCLHFSVVTIGTLGYGDIVPRSRGAKLASDLQVLSGIVLLAVALGMALGDWWKEKRGELALTKRRLIVWAYLLLISFFIVLGGFLKGIFQPSNEYIQWITVTNDVYEEAERGKHDNARIYAEKSLLLAAKYRTSWNYGNAIHEANAALGLIALRAGKTRDATIYLLRAGSTPGSPQLDSFGPNMALANELLKLGEQEAVLQYLDLCGLFWERKRGLLSEWESKINKGEHPNLVN